MLYTLFIGFVLIKCSQYEQQLKHIVAHTFETFPYAAYMSVYPIVIGFLMGLPKLISNFFKKGKWRFDMIKFVAVGIPALFITTIPLVHFSPLINHLVFPKLYVHFFHSLSLTTQAVAGIVFGYLMCSVLEKRN